MTQDEAVEETCHLKGLFPMMTVEQGEFWRDEFERFPLSAVRFAIGELPERPDGSIDRPRLLDLIRRKSKTAEERLADEKKLADERQKERVRQRKESNANRERVDAWISLSGDAHLANLAADVLNDLTPDSREFFAGRNPRTDPFLKSLIYEKSIACGSVDR